MEPGNGVALRPVSEDDLELLRRHRNDEATRKWLRDNEEISLQRQKDWFSYGIKNPDTYYKVATHGGVPVGLVKIKECHSWSNPRICVEVFANFRKMGLGKQVVEAGIAYARSIGVTKEIGSFVFLDNEAGMKLSERCGFAVDEQAAVRFFFREGKPRAYVRVYRKL